jgi:hypothetical protein
MRELRQLKDLRHENVNTFIGLFIDPNAPALIFEYGHRGSLEVSHLAKDFIDLKIYFVFLLGYS